MLATRQTPKSQSLTDTGLISHSVETDMCWMTLMYVISSHPEHVPLRLAALKEVTDPKVSQPRPDTGHFC